MPDCDSRLILTNQNVDNLLIDLTDSYPYRKNKLMNVYERKAALKTSVSQSTFGKVVDLQSGVM